jgi:hypothetical protein
VSIIPLPIGRKEGVSPLQAIEYGLSITIGCLWVLGYGLALRELVSCLAY